MPIGRYSQHSFIALIILTLLMWMTHSIGAQQGRAIGTESEEAERQKNAVAKLEQALADDPQNVRLRMSLANLLLQQGQIAQAVEEFEQIIKIKPDYRPVYVELAITYLELQKDERSAEVTLIHGLHYFPKDGALHSLMGHVQLAQAQRRFATNKLEVARAKASSARGHFQKTVDHSTDDDLRAAAYLGLGSCYHLKSDILRLQRKDAEAAEASEKASNAYHQAVTIQPELAQEVRQLEFELVLPPPRFPKGYSMTHLDVSMQKRLSRIRAKLAATEESNRGGYSK